MLPYLYPHAAGWKDPATSREAAASLNAASIREIVRKCVLTYGPMTTDECATILGLSVLTVRPRFSELRALGCLRDTTERRRNISGRKAVVWAVRPPDRLF